MCLRRADSEQTLAGRSTSGLQFLTAHLQTCLELFLLLAGGIYGQFLVWLLSLCKDQWTGPFLLHSNSEPTSLSHSQLHSLGDPLQGLRQDYATVTRDYNLYRLL